MLVLAATVFLLAQDTAAVAPTPVVSSTAAAAASTAGSPAHVPEPSAAPILDDILPAEIPLARTLNGWVSLSPSAAPAVGYEDPSISGGTNLENRWLIDGIDFGNVGFGSPGANSGAGFFGLAFPREFLGSVAVQGAGFDVESPSALGGVVDASTRFGSDVIHGSLFGTAAPTSLQSHRRQVYLVNGAPIIGHSSSDDGGAVVRGPIVPGTAYFAAGISRLDTSTSLSAPNGLPLANIGAAHVGESRLPYFASADVERGNHRLEAFVLGDGGAAPRGPQSPSDLLAASTARFSRIAFGVDGQRLHYSGRFPGAEGRVFGADLSISHATSRSLTTFDALGDTDRYTDFRTSPVTIGGGVGYYLRAQDGDSITSHAAIRAEIDGHGRHTIRAGIDLVSARDSIDVSRTGPAGATFVDAQGVPHTFETGLAYQVFVADDNVTPVYRVVRGTYEGRVHRATVLRTSPFVAERWELRRVTVDGAIRATSQTLRGSGPAAGHATFGFATGLSPRAGVTTRVGVGEARGTLYLRGARYIEDIPAAVAASEFSTERGVSRVDYSSASFTAANQIPNGTVPVNGGDTTHVITGTTTALSTDAGATPTTEDEITLGSDWELADAVSLSARVVHRSLAHVLEDYSTTSYDEILAGTATFGTPRLGNPGPGVGPGWRKPARDYDALELSAAKPFGDRALVVVAYRLSSLRGNYEGLARTEDSEAQPNFTSSFDFPNATPLMGGTGRPGALPLDRTHVLKLAGAWRTITGVGLGAVVNLESGAPRTSLGANLADGNAGEIVETRRGDLGRLPGVATLDVHADYALPLPHARALVASIDVFNATNSQTVFARDDFKQLDDGSPSPDFGRAIAYVPPRTGRLALRLDF